MPDRQEKEYNSVTESTNSVKTGKRLYNKPKKSYTMTSIAHQ